MVFHAGDDAVVDGLQKWMTLNTVVPSLALLYIVSKILPALYQVLFSPFPGPWQAKFTKWYLRYHDVASVGESSTHIEVLHQKYGDVVQIEPNHVSFRNGDAVREIFAGGSAELEREDQDCFLEHFGCKNIVSTGEPKLHKMRRVEVNRIYSIPAVTSKQSCLNTLVGHLVSEIDAQMDMNAASSKQELNIWPLLRYLSADIVTNFVYGHEKALDSLRNLEHRKLVHPLFKLDVGFHDIISGIWRAWYPVSARWVARQYIIPTWLSGLAFPRYEIHQWGMRLAKETLQTQEKLPTNPTHCEKLVDTLQSGNSPAVPSITYVASDTFDSFVAGLTTTSDVLSFLLWHLSIPANLQRQRKLRAEIESAGVHLKDHDEEIQPSELARLPYLDACIRETLRCNPPILVPLRRTIYHQKLVMSGYKIPANFNVSASPLSVNHHPGVFASPEQWIPERWSEAENESKEFREMMRHFLPFGSGPRMCIGMSLAWAQLRLTTAKIFSTYEVSVGKRMLDSKGELLSEGERADIFPTVEEEPLCFRKLV